MKADPVLDNRFSGFPPRAFELLRALGEHNERSWYAANRAALKAALVQPALALVVALGSLLKERVSPGIRAEPRVGGSILRLSHDARYVSAGPFRTHLELWFWEGAGSSRDNPGCFVRLAPDRLVVGAGMTAFPDGFRERYQAAVDQPAQGRELAAILHGLDAGGWSLEGRRARRVPAPYPSDHERRDLLRLLGLRVERTAPLPDVVFEPRLPELLSRELAQLGPLHRWLAAVA